MSSASSGGHVAEPMLGPGGLDASRVLHRFGRVLNVGEGFEPLHRAAVALLPDRQMSHRAGGRIVLQIWHGGRACHPLLNGGAVPVAPSAIAIANEEVHTPEGKQPYTVPRALADDELPVIVAGFAQAAQNAMAAGFDGVEVHGANGHLLDQFLRDGSNRRSGPYGGTRGNRARLMLDAVCTRIGSERLGLRISPINGFNDMRDSNPIGLATWLASSTPSTWRICT